MKNVLFLLTIIIGLSACNLSQKNKQVEDQITLKKEVMAIHDEVMPKMMYMEELQDSVQQMATEISDVSKAQEILATSDALDAGIQAMDIWMKSFKHMEKNENASHEEIMAYFEQEKETITKVKEKMLTGIDKAEQLLEAN